MKWQGNLGSEDAWGKHRKSNYQHFNSLAEAAALPPHPYNEREAVKYIHGLRTRAKRWLGDTYSQSVKIQRDGWHEGEKRLLELSQDLEIRYGKKAKANVSGWVKKRRRVRSRQGDELDIHSVRNGHLDRAWQVTQKTPRPTKIFNVTFGSSYSANVNAADMFYAGAVSIAVCNVLRRRRVSCQISAYVATSMKEDYYFDICLKQTHQSLNIRALSPACHGSFLRLPGFVMIRSTPENVISYAYGMPLRMSADMLKKREELTGNPCVHIPPITDHWAALNAMDAAMEQINKHTRA